MPSASDVAELRAAQVGVRSLVERDLGAFWGSLDLNRPERARDALLAFAPVLVATYGEAAAVVAADWYDEVRAADRVPGRFRAVMDVPSREVETVATVRRTAEALFTDTPTLMLTGLSAKVGKYALDGSRQTVTTSTRLDPRAVGWRRITRANACDFCRMLAGRGAVYTAATAEFHSHGDCNCAAAPAWA